MEDLREMYDLHTIEQAFQNYQGHRRGLIKAVIDDVDELRDKCNQYVVPEDEYLGLYGFPSGKWGVYFSADLPRKRFHFQDYINFLDKRWIRMPGWLDLLMILIFDQAERQYFFNMYNELPLIYEVVTGKAKKQVKDKSTVSYHSSNKSKSNSKVVQLKTSPVPHSSSFSEKDVFSWITVAVKYSLKDSLGQCLIENLQL